MGVFPLIFGSIRQVSMGQTGLLGVLLGIGFHLLKPVGRGTWWSIWLCLFRAFIASIILLLIASVWLREPANFIINQFEAVCPSTVLTKQLHWSKQS